MRQTIKRLAVVCLLLWLPLSAYADEPIKLCDKDLTDTEHQFHPSKLKTIIPDDLKPDEAKGVYIQFFDSYGSQLTDSQKTLPLVEKFIALQKDIINSKKSANLSLKPNFDGDVELSSGADKVADIPCGDRDKDYLIDIAYLATAYKLTHDGSWSEVRSAVTKKISYLGQQYEDWFNNGLPMWPQETWFNGLFLDESDAVKPNKYQYVLLRPSVGLGLNAAHSFDETKTNLTLGIEPVGYVRYMKDDYSEYWGVSLLITSGDDAGVGYGILGRYNSFVLGILRHDENKELGISKDDNYLFIGVDLFNLINEKENQFKEFKKKVKDNKRKVCAKIKC